MLHARLADVGTGGDIAATAAAVGGYFPVDAATRKSCSAAFSVAGYAVAI